MQKYQKAAIVVLLSVLMAGIGYAVIFERQVAHQINITVGLQVSILYQNGTALTSLDWGNRMRGVSISAKQAVIKNDGELTAHVTWSVAGLPAGMTLAMDWFDGSNWQSWAMNTGVLDINVGINKTIQFKPVVAANSTVGLGGFTTTFSAANED